MGFMSRSASMMRYRIKGEIEGPFWDTVDEGVRKGAFRATIAPGDEVGLGWTSMEDFTDSEFPGASYVRTRYVALSLRIDTARVPPRILEMHLKTETRRLMEETGKQRLSSGQRRELKEQLKESLKRQAFPSIQVHDVIWDTANGVVYFASLGAKARERFEDHFKKSFGLTLVPLLAYMRAEELLDGHSDKQILEKLKSTSLVP
ncbi:MAG TPA: recombination-associated protein RdgC [Desulfomonilaceae bacterium]|nr:recombination-associated protein RdgC [Desulfomonilaceae bacterium]